MTAPAMFRRNAADVQAMRLDSVADIEAACGWLRAHGLNVSPYISVRSLLTIYGPGSRMVARLGDWITLDVGSGAFTVVTDDGDKPQGHTSVEGDVA